MDLLIPIDRASDISLRDQIYGTIRVAIVDGNMVPGTRLPSTRDLARQLSISRLTVEDAYARLLAEEYLISRQGAGTFVAEDVSPKTPTGKSAAALSRKMPSISRAGKRAADIRLSCGEITAIEFSFDTGTPDLDAFPHGLWQRIMAREYRDGDPLYYTYGPEQGLPALREALAGYLARSRGLICSPDQIVITNGSQQSLDLLVRLMIDPGDRAIIENPTYSTARASLLLAGADILPIDVDNQGLRVEDLPASGPAAKVLTVTPSHQYPTGAMLPLARRIALLEWAGTHNTLVIEDDYDSELRYDARPVPALAALASTESCLGRVAYLGTFSKVVFPSLRLGYMVVDHDLIGHLMNLKRMVDRHPPQHLQSAAAIFINEGHFERHLARMRKRYSARQAFLIEQMEKHLGGIAFRNQAIQSAGLHVLYEFDVPMSEQELIDRAQQVGVGLRGASVCYATPPGNPMIMIGYSNLSETQIAEGIQRLSNVLKR